MASAGKRKSPGHPPVAVPLRLDLLSLKGLPNNWFDLVPFRVLKLSEAVDGMETSALRH